MKKYLIYIAIIAIVGFGFYKKIYIPKHTFELTHTTVGNMEVKVNGVGNVGTENTYKVATIYGGKILNFKVQSGDWVKKGEVIANIDFVDLKDKIDELKATMNKLSNDIESSKIDKESSYKQYLYQEELLKKNSQLFKKGAISELDFKKFKTDRDVAKLKVESLNSKIKSLNNQKVQTEASIKGLKAKLLRYTIISPIDGYVTKKYVSNFDVIAPNQPLIDVVNPKDVWIVTPIDTRISGDVIIGDIATIKLRSSDKIYPAKVVKINPINNNITNEREIEVKFDKLPIPFYLNEQAIVNIKIKQLKHIIKIPALSLVTYKENYGIWLLKNNNKVEFKKVDILAYGKKDVAVSNLTKDDIIVLPNPKNKALSNGMKIYHD